MKKLTLIILAFITISCHNKNSKYYKEGKLLYHDKNYIMAIEFFNKEIDINNKTDLVYHYRARAKQSIGEYEEAIIDFSKAIELNKKLISAHVNRAVCLVKMKKYDSALLRLNETINEFEPSLDSNVVKNLSIAYNNRGLIKHWSSNEYENALADFNKSLSFGGNSENYMPLMNRGVLFLELKEYEKAIADLGSSIELNDKKAWTHFMKAQAHFQMEDYPNTLKNINRAIKQEVNWRYYNLRGMTLNNLEKYDKALYDFDNAVNISNHDYVYNNRGFTKYKLGDLQGALLDCQTAMDLNDENSWTFYNLGLINYEIGNKKKACDYFTKAMALGKEEAKIELENKCQ